jgi:uncharacterized protein (TIGR03437 family)
VKLLAFSFLLSATATLGFAQAPAITSGGVLNGASFASGQQVTPGSLISIFGTNLASNVAAADTIPLSTSLGGVSVQFVNGNTTLPAPLLFVQAGQVNAQIPWELVPNGTTATVNVIVNNNGVASAPEPVQVGPASPGVFAANGLAVAVNFSDGTLAWPTNAVPGLATHPAKAGDVLIIYATGMGAVDTTPADGDNGGANLRTNLVTPQVTIGGVSAQVIFSGLSPQFVGVNQVNVIVPNVAAGNSLPLQIQSNGITSPATTTMAVGQ